jgi:hypothetical protein
MSVNAAEINKKKPFEWKLFFVVLILLAIGVLAKVPAFIQIQGLVDKPEVWGRAASMIFIEQFLIFGLIPTGLGLLLASKLNLKIPLLENWLAGGENDIRVGKLFRDVGLITIGLAAAGIFLQALIQRDLSALNLASGAGKAQTGWWSMLLLAFSAGVTEESVYRLGILTITAAVMNLLWKPRGGRLKPGAFWLANILTALIFSVSHFANFAAMPVSPGLGLLWKTVAGNSIAALGFGWLYWKRGLESAMLSHFLLDVCLYVGAPSLLAAMAQS